MLQYNVFGFYNLVRGLEGEADGCFSDQQQIKYLFNLVKRNVHDMMVTQKHKQTYDTASRKMLILHILILEKYLFKFIEKTFDF